MHRWFLECSGWSQSEAESKFVPEAKKVRIFAGLSFVLFGVMVETWSDPGATWVDHMGFAVMAGLFAMGPVAVILPVRWKRKVLLYDLLDRVVAVGNEQTDWDHVDHQLRQASASLDQLKRVDIKSDQALESLLSELLKIFAKV